jgi:hypothetical protein
LKKRSKKTLLLWVRAFENASASTHRSFLFLFYKKETFLCCHGDIPVTVDAEGGRMVRDLFK